VAYFGFVYRHSLEALVGPVQSITVTAAVLGGGGGFVSALPGEKSHHLTNILKGLGGFHFS